MPVKRKEFASGTINKSYLLTLFSPTLSGRLQNITLETLEITFPIRRMMLL